MDRVIRGGRQLARLYGLDAEDAVAMAAAGEDLCTWEREVCVAELEAERMLAHDECDAELIADEAARG